MSGSRSHASSPIGFWVGACLVMFLSSFAPAAPATDLRGRVESQSNLSASPLPLLGLRVDLMDSAGKRAIASTHTGPDGLYYFRGVAPGNYVIGVAGDTYPFTVESRNYQDISPIRATAPVASIELRGGYRVALQGEFEGKVWVYVSPVCGTPCKPQMLVFETDPKISSFADFVTMNLLRPLLRKDGKLLFDNPVGPEAVEAMIKFGGRYYRLTGRTNGQIDSGGTILLEAYKQ